MFRKPCISLCICALLVFISNERAFGELETTSPPPAVQQNDQGRPWDLSIRTFFGYNDNVQVVPELPPFFIGDRDSAYGGITVKGAYRFIQTDDWTVGASLVFDQLWYAEEQPKAFVATASDANDYDLSAVQPSLYVDYHFDVMGRKASVGMSYDYRWDDAPIPATGIQAHTLTFRGSIYVLPQLQVSLSYAHGWDNFDVKWPGTTALNERDGERDVFSISAKYSFHGGLRSIKIGYTYYDNDSEGTNFRYDSNGLNVRFESHLIGPLWGAFGFSYSRGDYGGFTGGGVPAPGRQHQESFVYNLQLIWVINRHWSVDFYYKHSDYRSNLSQFEAEVNNVGMGVTFKF